MVLGAWRTGEPGVFFSRRGEPLQPGAAPRRVRGDQPVRRAAAAAVRRLQPRLGERRLLRARRAARLGGVRRDIRTSTHFLDNIIDVNKYPLPEIDALSKRIRRIGLGVMGFADALVSIGVPYDTPEGVEMGRRVMEFLDVEGKKESERLRHERGPFPEWARSIWGPDETCARDAAGSASARCRCSATATSRRSRRRGRSRSSPAARRGWSRCSRSRSCATRRA
jgi:ribonucleoside-diphosphate reductase alpha chain